MFLIKVAEKVKSNILLSTIFLFFPKIMPFERKCGKNMTEPDRSKMTI